MLTEDETVKRWRDKWMMLGMDKWAALQGDKLSQATAKILMETPADIDSLIRRMYADITKPNGDKK